MVKRAFLGLGLGLLIGITQPRILAAPVKFLKAGQEQKAIAEDQLPTLTKPSWIEVYEPHEQKNVRYRGLPTQQVFDSVFGADWRKAEEVLFTCVDGYQPSIPVHELTQHSSYLVFEREGSPQFSLTNSLQNQEKVALAPLYLVWDNLKNPALKAEGASMWPYQIVAIDLVKFKDRFAGMAPTADASAAAVQGFLQFRKACANCHRINGVGGEKSIELNFPASVTEYYKGDFLKRWIDQPQSLRWNSLMPPFNPDHPNRKQAIDDIISYLKHMAAHKQAPSP